MAPELTALGFEVPEQLGALFIGGAGYLRGITGDVPPLVDDHPKRITAPWGGPDEIAGLLESWLDADSARERFRESPLIARLWPLELRNASLPYFDLQRIISSFEFDVRSAEEPRIAGLHQVLTRSDLRAPVLWLLGSDADLQRVVDHAGPELRSRPDAQLQIAIGHLARREYEAALEPLRRAGEAASLRREALGLRIYALCLQGEMAQAQRLAGERQLELEADGEFAATWAWMRKTFGVDPLAGAVARGRAPPP